MRGLWKWIPRFSLRFALVCIVAAAALSAVLAPTVRAIMRGRAFRNGVIEIRSRGIAYTKRGMTFSPRGPEWAVEGLLMQGSLVTDQTLVDVEKYFETLHIRWLDCSGSQVSNEGVDLATRDHDRMLLLSFAGCNIDDEAIPLLARCKRLRFVDLSKTNVTPNGVARLNSERPTLEVRY